MDERRQLSASATEACMKLFPTMESSQNNEFQQSFISRGPPLMRERDFQLQDRASMARYFDPHSHGSPNNVNNRFNAPLHTAHRWSDAGNPCFDAPTSYLSRGGAQRGQRQRQLRQRFMSDADPDLIDMGPASRRRKRVSNETTLRAESIRINLNHGRHEHNEDTKELWHFRDFDSVGNASLTPFRQSRGDAQGGSNSEHGIHSGINEMHDPHRANGCRNEKGQPGYRFSEPSTHFTRMASAQQLDIPSQGPVQNLKRPFKKEISAQWPRHGNDLGWNLQPQLQFPGKVTRFVKNNDHEGRKSQERALEPHEMLEPVTVGGRDELHCSRAPECYNTEQTFNEEQTASDDQCDIAAESVMLFRRTAKRLSNCIPRKPVGSPPKRASSTATPQDDEHCQDPAHEDLINNLRRQNKSTDDCAVIDEQETIFTRRSTILRHLPSVRLLPPLLAGVPLSKRNDRNAHVGQQEISMPSFETTGQVGPESPSLATWSILVLAWISGEIGRLLGFEGSAQVSEPGIRKGARLEGLKRAFCLAVGLFLVWSVAISSWGILETFCSVLKPVLWALQVLLRSLTWLMRL